MRTIVYPTNIEELSMEEAVPIVSSLLSSSNNEECSSHSSKKLMEVAINARRELISNLANVDEIMEDLYLLATLEQDDDGSGEENIEDYITTDEIQASIRRMTLQRKVMPTLCGAALRGVGVEPLLDCVAEYCKFSASYMYVCVSMKMYDCDSVYLYDLISCC
jgi:elongation factor G